MIQVDFQMSRDKKLFSLHLEGHSGMADSGKDIICAAASIITYTIADAVFALWKENKLRRAPVVNLHKGKAFIVFSPKRLHYKEAINLFSFAISGYRLINSEYPNYLNITRLG